MYILELFGRHSEYFACTRGDDRLPTFAL
jgi:hypothetical protein